MSSHSDWLLRRSSSGIRRCNPSPCTLEWARVGSKAWSCLAREGSDRRLRICPVPSRRDLHSPLFSSVRASRFPDTLSCALTLPLDCAFGSCRLTFDCVEQRYAPVRQVNRCFFWHHALLGRVAKPAGCHSVLEAMLAALALRNDVVQGRNEQAIVPPVPKAAAAIVTSIALLDPVLAKPLDAGTGLPLGQWRAEIGAPISFRSRHPRCEILHLLCLCFSAFEDNAGFSFLPRTGEAGSTTKDWVMTTAAGPPRGCLHPPASAGAKCRMGCRRGVSGYPDTQKPDQRASKYHFDAI